MAESHKPSVLFLCTGNSCRSQMAEGWTRHFHRDLRVYSAGLEAHGLNPRAVRVMQEAGVDISGQTSDPLDSLPVQEFDLVVTVCGHADANCPNLGGRGTCKIHAGFDDPPKLAAGARSEEEALAHFRRVRDEIRSYIQNELLRELEANKR